MDFFVYRVFLFLVLTIFTVSVWLIYIFGMINDDKQKYTNIRLFSWINVPYNGNVPICPSNL